MSKIKQAYERNIEPNMRVIATAANEFGIPMFATFQVAPNEFKSFCVHEDRSNWLKIKYMDYLDQTWSLDDFMEVVIHDAIQNGHDSAILHALGIPKNPTDNAKIAAKLKNR